MGLGLGGVILRHQKNILSIIKQSTIYYICMIKDCVVQLSENAVDVIFWRRRMHTDDGRSVLIVKQFLRHRRDDVGEFGGTGATITATAIAMTHTGLFLWGGVVWGWLGHVVGALRVIESNGNIVHGTLEFFLRRHGFFFGRHCWRNVPRKVGWRMSIRSKTMSIQYNTGREWWNRTNKITYIFCESQCTQNLWPTRGNLCKSFSRDVWQEPTILSLCENSKRVNAVNQKPLFFKIIRFCYHAFLQHRSPDSYCNAWDAPSHAPSDGERLGKQEQIYCKIDGNKWDRITMEVRLFWKSKIKNKLFIN